MARGVNAELAVTMYQELRDRLNLDKDTAWKAIAVLLLSCKVWDSGGWRDFHDCVVYRERNDFKVGKNGPNATIRKAEDLSSYLSLSLGCEREDLCSVIGKYWDHHQVANSQPHNLLGHAFRSIITEILSDFGNSAVSYEEEVPPKDEFPGYEFKTRSKGSKLDIVARKNNRTVALLSTRWRFRHDRVDLVDEAHAYVPAAKRTFSECNFYAVVGEFSAARLHKILENCPPESPNGIIEAGVHFKPELVTEGLGENGRLVHLKSLKWLIEQTFSW